MMYLNLCTQVYDLSKPSPPKKQYEFYRKYLTKANGLILEPMCGTGRFLLPFISEGFKVHGFDGSQHMLDALYKKTEEKNLKVNVWQGLAEDFHKKERYKLIFIPDGSFGLITNIQAVKTALKKFYDNLTEDGVLVFEAETLQSAPQQLGVWRGSIWIKDDGKFILSSFLDLPLESNVKTTICRYELIAGSSITKTEIETLQVYLYNPIVLSTLLKEVGFRKIKLIKAFEHDKKPGRNDEVIVYECHK
jgi:hypothetical protein